MVPLRPVPYWYENANPSDKCRIETREFRFVRDDDGEYIYEEMSEEERSRK